jgi:DNA-binding NarL/FixJ family response regulator
VLRVLVLEDDEDLRSILCELLSLSGAEECVDAGSLAELKRKRLEALGCGLAILDINLGAQVPSGLEAHDWLKENGFSGRTVFLTGHARSHPLVRQALELSHAQVLSKPIEAKVIVALVGGGPHGAGPA